MTRLKANREIMKMLSKAIRDNPDARFGQILRNLGVVRITSNLDGLPTWINEFNTESSVTLELMKKERSLRN